MTIEETVAELKSPEKFDARKALTGASYPTEEVKVYVDAALMHEANKLSDEAAKLQEEAASLKAQADRMEAGTNGGIVPDEGWEEVAALAEAKQEEAAEAEAAVAALIEQVRDSGLIFKMKGLAPKQVQLIDKKWRRAIKFPARSNYENTPEGQEEFELETFERNMERNQKINHDAIANSILSVTNGKGEVDGSAWKTEDVEELFETLLETEYEKLRLGYQDLTFAHTMFNKAIVEDTDFLSKR